MKCKISALCLSVLFSNVVFAADEAAGQWPNSDQYVNAKAGLAGEQPVTEMEDEQVECELPEALKNAYDIRVRQAILDANPLAIDVEKWKQLPDDVKFELSRLLQTRIDQLNPEQFSFWVPMTTTFIWATVKGLALKQAIQWVWPAAVERPRDQELNLNTAAREGATLMEFLVVVPDVVNVMTLISRKSEVNRWKATGERSAWIKEYESLLIIREMLQRVEGLTA